MATDDFDFGSDDLDIFDFDFDDDFDDDLSGKKKKDRTAIEDFTKEAGKETVSALKSSLMNPGVLRRLMAHALPKGYAQVFNAYDGIKQGVADTYKENQSEIDPYLRKAKTRLDRMSSNTRRLVPKEIIEAIEEADESGKRRSTYDDPDAELNANIAGIDKLIAANGKARLNDTILNASKDIRERKQFGLEMDYLATIGKGIGRLVGYQDKITINYQRKSLEIGYRHLDIAVKTLRGQQAFHNDAKTILDAVRHNTALPDFVKMRTTEVIKQQVANRLAAAAANSAGGWVSGYFKNIRKNFSEYLGGGLQGLSAMDEMGGGEISRAQMAGIGGGQLLGQVVAGLATWLGEEGANRAAPYLARVPGIQAGGNFLRRNLTGIPQRLNEYAKSETTSTDWFGLKGLMEEHLKSLLDRHSPVSTITGTDIKNLDQPAVFDMLFHKSVTEIIPGYLASMDRTLRSLYSGSDQEENAYSHYTGGFVTRSTLNEQHVRITLKGGDRGGLRMQVDTLLREMGADTLSDLAKRALRLQLMKDMTSANDFKPERYVKVATWSHVEQPIAEELIEFFAKTFGLNIVGDVVDDRQEIKDKTAEVREKFLDLTQRLPNYGANMDIQQNQVGRRAWRELGLSQYNGQYSDIINLDKLYDMLVNDVAEDNLPPEEKKEKKKFKVGSREDMIRQLEEAAAAAREEMKKKKKALGPSGEDVDTIGKSRGDYFGPRPPVPPTPPTPDPAPPTPGPIPPWPIPPYRIPPDPQPAPGPISVTAEVKFPELMKVEDLIARDKLDDSISLLDQNNSWLELILDALLHMDGIGNGGGSGNPGGGAGDGSGDAGNPGGGPTPPRRGLLRRGVGAIGRGLGWYFKTTYGLIGKGAKLGFKGAAGAATLPFQNIDGLGVSDVHVSGDPEPSMLAKRIRRGEYINVADGKVIKTLRDITGEVRDIGNNVVITKEEYERGLTNGAGESLAGFGLRFGAKAAGVLGRGMAAYTTGVYGAMWKATKWVAKKLFVGEPRHDVFFPGEEKPRIRIALLDLDWYRNEDGSIIRSLDDIKGPVYTPEKDVVITAAELEQFKGLYRRDGSLAWRMGKGTIKAAGSIASMVGEGLMTYGKFVGRVYKGAWKGLKGIVGGIFGKRKRGAAGSGGTVDEEIQIALMEIGAEQLSVQRGILDLLQKQYDSEHVRGDFDGDGIKENSWRDVLKNRRAGKAGAAAAAAAAASSPTVEAIDNMSKIMEKKLDKLTDATQEAGEASFLDQAADFLGLGGGRNGPPGPPGGPPGNGPWWKRAGKAVWKGAKWGAMTALPWLVRGAGTIIMGGASLIGGALSAPVVAGIAVAASVGYLGYRYWKASKAKDWPLLYLRMTQYGVAPTDKERVEAIIQLEGKVKANVQIGADGKGKIDQQGLDLPGIYKIFGVTPGDEDREQPFATWLQQRFRPVYLAHCSAMHSIKNTTDLSSADTSIGDGDLEAYLKTVDIQGMQDVYDDDDNSPFSSDLDTDADDVADAFKLVRSKRANKKIDEGVAAAAGAVLAAKNPLEKNTTLDVAQNGTGDIKAIEKGLKLTEQSTKIALAAGGFYESKGVTVKSLQSLDIATAVRFIAYGLKELKLDKCKQLSMVEGIYWAKIRYVGTTKATIDANLGELERQVLDVFKPETDILKEDIKRWLSFRFIPTLMQYAVSMRRRYVGFAQDGASKISGHDLKEVLEETIDAKAEVATGTVPIWTILNSPWAGVQLESMVGSTKRYIDSINTGSADRELKVLGLKDSEASAAAKGQAYEKSLTNTALAEGAAAPTDEQKTSAFDRFMKVLRGESSSSPSSQANYSGTASGKGQGDGALLMPGGGPAAAGMGNAVHPGGGTGGDVNSLPMPADDSGMKNAKQRWANVRDVIIGAGKMVGVDPAMMATIAAKESGFKIRAKATTSSASGLFQFIDGTWAAMLKKYGRTYGISPMATQYDPRANAILGACYMKENYEALSKHLKRPVTDTDIYMAHFLGTGGSRKFLTAPSNDPASAHVTSGQVNANATIFKSNGRMRTVSEVIQVMSNGLDKSRQMHDLTQGSAPVDTKVSSPAGTSGIEGMGGNAPAGQSASTPVDKPLDTAPPTTDGKPTAPEAPVNPAGQVTMPTREAGAVESGAEKAAQNATAAATPVAGAPSTPVAQTTPTKPEEPEAPTPVPTPSVPATPTQAAAQEQVKTQQQQAPVIDYSTTMNQHLEVARSSDSTLKSIERLLESIKTQQSAPKAMQAQQPGPAQSPEPGSRSTVNNTRRLAQT